MEVSNFFKMHVVCVIWIFLSIFAFVMNDEVSMKNACEIYTLSFPNAKNIVVSGDIHGEFNQLVHKLCVQYAMRDTLLIVAGDCGFGFDNPGYYDEMVKKNSRRMSEANNWIVFVRGNHDNPAYFDGETFRHRRFIAVPDYSIIQACGHTILAWVAPYLSTAFIVCKSGKRTRSNKRALIAAPPIHDLRVNIIGQTKHLYITMPCSHASMSTLLLTL